MIKKKREDRELHHKSGCDRQPTQADNSIRIRNPGDNTSRNIVATKREINQRTRLSFSSVMFSFSCSIKKEMQHQIGCCIEWRREFSFTLTNEGLRLRLRLHRCLGVRR